ncbi:MAG: DUF6814 family protein [Chitinophagaceae bacterium]
MNKTDSLKRGLGIVWMMLGPLAIAVLLFTAYKTIYSSAKGDIGNPVPWVIIISVFTPIAIGLTLFGWYSWKGEYDEENEL